MARKATKRQAERLAGAACQIVFEYEGWGDEHVDDYFRSYKQSGQRPPCKDADTLGSWCNRAKKLRKENDDFEAVMKQLTQEIMEQGIER